MGFLSKVALIGCLAVHPAFGWGGDGHRISTSLAEELVSPTASAFLRDHIGNDVVRASTWADSLDAEQKYPDSNFYHFSSTPYRKCAHFQMNRDCGFGRTKGLCIVTGLRDAIMRSMDPYLSTEIRSDALKFVIHLMADIHQPLHTGFREDTGGLRIGLSRPNGTDLHYIWDTWLINEAKRRQGLSRWDKLADVLRGHISKSNGAFIQRVRGKVNISEVLSSEASVLKYVESLASETATNVTCKFGYQHNDGSWIGAFDEIDESSFYHSRYTILIVQLSKAAVRLSHLIDGIAEAYSARHREMRRAAYAKSERELRNSPVAHLFKQSSLRETRTTSLKYSNIFAELWLEPPSCFEDFDTAGDWDSRDTTSATATKSKHQGNKKLDAKTREREDMELLDSAVETMTRERNSYVFGGVDLSEIVLVQAQGISLVTSKSRATRWRRMEFELKRSLKLRINFSVPGTGTIQRQFVFDHFLFSHETLTFELVIRAILKISRVDPRIDITDYLETIRPIERPNNHEMDPIYIHLYLRERERRDNRIEESASAVFDQIKLHRRHIVSINLGEQAIAFLLISTLQKPPATRRFNVLCVPKITGKGSEIMFWDVIIDPMIFDVSIGSNENMSFLAAIADRNSQLADRFYGTTLVKELREVAEYVQQFDTMGHPTEATRGKHADWLYMYRVESKILPGSFLEVAEWFQKDRFHTQEALAAHLGVDLLMMKPEVETTLVPIDKLITTPNMGPLNISEDDDLTRNESDSSSSEDSESYDEPVDKESYRDWFTRIRAFLKRCFRH